MANETPEEENSEEESSDTQPTTSKLAKVKKDLDALKAANDEVEKELLRKEELRARIQLGGQSEAGQLPPKPKEVTKEDIAEKFENGEMDILQ